MIHPSRSLGGWTAALLVFVAGVVFARADEAVVPGAEAQQSAYRSSIAQESVRKQADKIQADLLRLVQEAKLNGLDNSGLGTLGDAAGHLSSLSQGQMQQVINALQSASISADEPKRERSLVSAYDGQKELVLKLKALAALLTAQQTRQGLALQLENLIARQSTNIRATTILKTGGHAVAQLDVHEKPVYDVAGAEQTSIGGEIELLFTTLSAAPAATTDDDSSESAQAVLDAMNAVPLRTTAQSATQLTRDGPFPDAVTRQTTVRDDLTVLLRAALEREDASTRLQEAKTQLDQLAEDQKDLTDATKQAKIDPATLAQRQNEISDRAEVAKALLKPLNTDAAQQVNDAQQAMQQPAPPGTEQADQDLAAAQKLLDQQLAAEQDAQSQSPTDELAQLQKAQDEIKQAEQAPNPQDAQKEVQQAQQDALAQAPDAAGKLADAADQMQQAQPDASAINQDLAQASADLQQRQNAMAQAAQEYQALADAGAQLDAAKQLAIAADQDLQKGTGHDLSTPARQLNDAQKKVDPLSQGALPGIPGAAQQALQQADDALKTGSIQAVEAKRGEADAQAQKGIAAINQAQGALAQAMTALQEQGQPGRGPGSAKQVGQADTPADSRQTLVGRGDPAETGSGLVVGGLSPKDRDAITQFQAEKTPPEYAPMVQQYLKNLADSSQTP